MTTMTATTRLALIVTIATSLAVSSIGSMSTSAFAESKKLNKDFDITKVGINSDGNPFIQVSGTAGGTKPPEETDIIYGYFVWTNTGVWVINAHAFSHGQNTGDDQWHNERVVFDKNNVPKCLVGAEDAGGIVLDAHNAIFTGTGATKVYNAMTIQLEHLMSTDKVCDDAIAKVTQILDKQKP